jgi:hypothetical protein
VGKDPHLFKINIMLLALLPLPIIAGIISTMAANEMASEGDCKKAMINAFMAGCCFMLSVMIIAMYFL